MQIFQSIVSLSPSCSGLLRDTKTSEFFHTVLHDGTPKS